MRLAGKVSIITGAASGMGQAAAVIFAKEGSMVVAADIDEEGLKRTEAQVREARGRDVLDAHPVRHALGCNQIGRPENDRRDEAEPEVQLRNHHGPLSRLLE